jgi:HAD superfamily hydrolase (TIGR01509 family)
MSTLRAVVFDFDGVLADTERLHLVALRATLATRGWTLTDEDYFTHYLGYDDRGCLTEFARRQGVSLSGETMLALLGDKEERYATLFARGEVLYPTARACIERLAEVFPLAIASGSLRGEIETILDANDLLSFFSVIVGADDVKAGKPAPESYVRAVDLLGVAGAEAVAIEDSPWGLQSARGAGLRTIGITTSYAAPALTDAMHVVTSLDDITPAFLLSSQPTTL